MAEGKFSFKQYWDEKGEEIKQKRNSRYANDPEYREKQRARARDYARRKALERKNKPAPARVARRARRPKTVLVEGNETVMYTVGTLAKAVGRTTQTVNAWETRGFVPKTPFVGPGGVRLFTQGMIEAFVSVIDGKEIRFDDESVRAEIADAWSALGVRDGIDFEVQ